jgi:hypothetical protein
MFVSRVGLKSLVVNIFKIIRSFLYFHRMVLAEMCQLICDIKLLSLALTLPMSLSLAQNLVTVMLRLMARDCKLHFYYLFVIFQYIGSFAL